MKKRKKDNRRSVKNVVLALAVFLVFVVAAYAFMSQFLKNSRYLKTSVGTKVGTDPVSEESSVNSVGSLMPLGVWDGYPINQKAWGSEFVEKTQCSNRTGLVTTDTSRGISMECSEMKFREDSANLELCIRKNLCNFGNASIKGLPGKFSPNYILTHDHNGDGKYTIMLFDGSIVYYCEGSECDNGFKKYDAIANGLPVGYEPTLAYSVDLDKDKKENIYLWSASELYYCEEDECSKGFKHWPIEERWKLGHVPVNAEITTVVFTRQPHKGKTPTFSLGFNPRDKSGKGVFWDFDNNRFDREEDDLERKDRMGGNGYGYVLVDGKITGDSGAKSGTTICQYPQFSADYGGYSKDRGSYFHCFQSDDTGKYVATLHSLVVPNDIAPVKLGYSFNPEFSTLPAQDPKMARDLHDYDFSASKMSSAGTSSISGVTRSKQTTGDDYTLYGNVFVQCNGYSAFSDSSGNFSIDVPNGTICNLIAYKSGYKFLPLTPDYSRTAIVSGQNISYPIVGNLYTLINGEKQPMGADGYAIGGNVADTGGKPIAGVSVSCGGKSVGTDKSGNFIIAGVANGTSCTLTPSKSGYAFSPTNKSISISGADQFGINFVGTSGGGTDPNKYSISGTISGIVQQGIKITCGSYSATSDSTGKYTIASVPNETSCSLTPSYSDGTNSIYKFTPTSYSISISGANITGKDFSSIKSDPGGEDCSDLGKDIADPKTEFDLSDIAELEKIYLSTDRNKGKDINGDGKFTYADVIALINCYNCKWDWDECFADETCLAGECGYSN